MTPSETPWTEEDYEAARAAARRVRDLALFTPVVERLLTGPGELDRRDLVPTVGLPDPAKIWWLGGPSRPTPDEFNLP